MKKVTVSETRTRGEHKSYQGEKYREIICGCCKHKALAKLHSDGKIYVWCKERRKEVELEVEPYEPNRETTYIKPKLR